MILNDIDFTQIKELTKANPAAWSVLKSWSLLKPTWKAMFQAAEDWFVTAFSAVPTTSFKAALEAVAGSMTNTQAKWVGKVWFMWRVGKDW